MQIRVLLFLFCYLFKRLSKLRALNPVDFYVCSLSDGRVRTYYAANKEVIVGRVDQMSSLCSSLVGFCQPDQIHFEKTRGALMEDGKIISTIDLCNG